jgi:hypothetical protein
MKLFIVLTVLVLLTGCTQALQVIDRGANIDIETMQAGRITNPKYIEAWPTFSGYFKGFLGPEGKDLIPPSAYRAWGELDKTAARYAKGEKLTDEEMSYFFGTKFGRVLTPVVLAIIEKNVTPSVWALFNRMLGL